MPPFHDSAIVLRRVEFSESSQVLAVLTRDHGQIRIIAKGSRRSTKKSYRPGLDLLDVGDLVFSARHVGQATLATLVEWHQRRSFSGLRDKLERWHAAHYAADVVSAMTADWDPAPALYDALLEGLTELNEAGDILPAVVRLQKAVLEQAGWAPRWDVCVECGRTPAGAFYFSSFEGGPVCRDCEPARVEKRQVFASAVSLQKGDFQTRGDVAGAFDLFHYHLSHLMGRAPASGDVLLQSARGHFVSHPRHSSS